MDMLRLTLRQLQIFVAVARHGSTTAASAEVALSQSATSSAINELERTLALRLFDRAGRRLLLNEQGRSLLALAQGLLDRAAEVESMARDANAQLQSVRIGASTTIGNHLLPGLLARFFAQRHSDAATWRSQVAIGNTADICARVAAFELDIGLIEGPCHEAALRVHPWLRDEMVVVAAPDSDIARVVRRSRPAQRMTLKMLRDAVWLVREAGSGTREASDRALLPYLRSYRRCIELESSTAIMHAASAGLGLAFLSRWVVGELVEAGRLCTVETTMPQFSRQCYWVLHRDKQPTLALEQLIRLLGRPPTASAAR